MQDFVTYQGFRFHSLWLRDNCPCSECRHENGQRLHETWKLPADIKIENSVASDDTLTVYWAEPYPHKATFSHAFLVNNAYDKAPAIQSDKVLWGGGFDLPNFEYEQVLADDKQRFLWLNAVAKYGVTKLSGVPDEAGMILKVVDLFGFVRETNYGTIFEVRTEENPQNLAYTPLPLSLHTDNPYRDPVPTLQLLHCLKQALQGGVTALVDGFKAAEILRKEDPEAFELLSTEAVSFRFNSDDANLNFSGQMISTTPQGEITNIRINNRSCAPFNIAFDKMEHYYRAYQALMSIVQSERCKTTLKLQEGELLLFDNERVMHGREVQAIGTRHLQGCYADKDSLLSTVALLNTQTES
ncbi:MAG: 2-trimethylaminoethylphosphonate dioxygenase [Leucothrix sp.]